MIEHSLFFTSFKDDEYGEKSISVKLDGEEVELCFIDHPSNEMSVSEFQNLSFLAHTHTHSFEFYQWQFTINPNVIHNLKTNTHKNVQYNAIFHFNNEAIREVSKRFAINEMTVDMFNVYAHT